MSDLLAAIDAAAAMRQKQPGEYTHAEMVERAGSEWACKKFMRENKDRITSRQIGPKLLVYRLK